MILMPQIFDVIANENPRYKRNELELFFFSEWSATGSMNTSWSESSDFEYNCWCTMSGCFCDFGRKDAQCPGHALNEIFRNTKKNFTVALSILQLLTYFT